MSKCAAICVKPSKPLLIRSLRIFLDFQLDFQKRHPLYKLEAPANLIVGGDFFSAKRRWVWSIMAEELIRLN